MRAVGLAEIRSIFGVDGETGHVTLIGFERCWELESVPLYRLSEEQRTQMKELVDEYRHPCAVVLEKDGVEYWVSDQPGGSGPGSWVIMLFNVTESESTAEDSFRVASLNNYRHAITKYSNDMWLKECAGMALPWRMRPRSVEVALSKFGH